MATITWIGTTSTLWSTATNWVGGVIPHTTDAVVFDVTGVARACTVDGLNDWSGGTLTVNSAYANTITQNTGININCAAYSQTGATMTCSATATFTSTTFSVTGGTFNQGGAFVSTTFALTNAAIFVGSSASMSTTAVTYANTSALTATSGTWTLAGSWTQSNTATFTHNSGTINITAASTVTDTVATFNKFTVNTTAANVTVAASTTMPLGATPSTSLTTGTLTVTGTLTYSGVWTHTGNITVSATTGTVTGSSTPSLALANAGSLNISATAAGWTSVNILVNGSGGAQVYTDTGAKNSGVWTLTIGNSGYVVAASTAMNLGTNPTANMNAGGNTLTVNGTLTYAGALTVDGALNVSSGGVLTGTTTPTMLVSRGITINSTATITNAIATVTINGTLNSTITDTGDKLAASTYVISKSGATGDVTVASSTIVRLGSSPATTTGTTSLTVTGTVTFSGTWSHTGLLTATGTVTGTSTPVINVTEGAVNFTSVTFTNPISVTMNQTSATSRTFTGGAKTYTTFTRTGSGSGTLIIASGNTFTAFQDNAGAAAHTLQFTAGTTQTGASFLISGSNGKLITLNSSSAGSAATLTTTGGQPITVTYATIKDSTVDASPVWYYGTGASLVSGTTNWIFLPPGVAGGSDIGGIGGLNAWMGIGRRLLRKQQANG